MALRPTAPDQYRSDFNRLPVGTADVFDVQVFCSAFTNFQKPGTLPTGCCSDATSHIQKDVPMNLIILLVVGGIIGWIASMIMNTDAQQGVFLNIVVGIVGAMLAGFVVTPLIGGASITEGAINIQSIVVSLIGAIVLLGIVNLVRRGSVR
jgi:uncharacterized membrane protein YeaQ/YmgE (transglycosylase-associated protein family)